MPQFTVEATKGGKPVKLRVNADSERAAAEKAMLAGHSVASVEPFDPDIQVVHATSASNGTGEHSTEVLRATLLRSLIQDIDSTAHLTSIELGEAIRKLDLKSASDIAAAHGNAVGWGVSTGLMGAFTCFMLLIVWVDPQPRNLWIVGGAFALSIFMGGMFFRTVLVTLRKAKIRRETYIKESHEMIAILEQWHKAQLVAANRDPAAYVRASLPDRIAKACGTKVQSHAPV